jgi:nicotinate-nucleotide adenylyltransferase
MRIGIYEGTFSPPHLGHVAAAKAFMEQMWLDVLYIIPTGIPPHKAAGETASPMERLAMCERAFSSLEGVIISDIELRQQGQGNTVETLRQIAQRAPEDSRLFLLMGTDMLLSMDSLHGVDQIFRLCYPVYMRREGADPVLDGQIVKQIEKLNARYGKVVRRIVGEPLPISSTKIRSLIAQGKSIQGLVPAAVEQYIHDHNLYV